MFFYNTWKKLYSIWGRLCFERRKANEHQVSNCFHESSLPGWTFVTYASFHLGCMHEGCILYAGKADQPTLASHFLSVFTSKCSIFVQLPFELNLLFSSLNLSCTCLQRDNFESTKSKLVSLTERIQQNARQYFLCAVAVSMKSFWAKYD